MELLSRDMKDTNKMVVEKVMVFIIIRMVQFIKEIGIKASLMAMEPYLNIRMGFKDAIIIA